jgi:hypothetical protein
MCSRSFRARYRRLVPQAGPGKPACLLAASILAGCGGAGEASTQQIHGPGYSFAAPSAWSVTQAATSIAASNGPVDRVQVQTFQLVKPYRSELFSAAATELDQVAAKLARQLRGRVTMRSSTHVNGRDARVYRIDYGRKVDEITFVLDDVREYELLCRRAAVVNPGNTCGRFVRSFRLD